MFSNHFHKNGHHNHHHPGAFGTGGFGRGGFGNGGFGTGLGLRAGNVRVGLGSHRPHHLCTCQLGLGPCARCSLAAGLLGQTVAPYGTPYYQPTGGYLMAAAPAVQYPAGQQYPPPRQVYPQPQGQYPPTGYVAAGQYPPPPPAGFYLPVGNPPGFAAPGQYPPPPAAQYPPVGNPPSYTAPGHYPPPATVGQNSAAQYPPVGNPPSYTATVQNSGQNPPGGNPAASKPAAVYNYDQKSTVIQQSIQTTTQKTTVNITTKPVATVATTEPAAAPVSRVVFEADEPSFADEAPDDVTYAVIANDVTTHAVSVPAESASHHHHHDVGFTSHVVAQPAHETATADLADVYSFATTNDGGDTGE